MFAARPCPGAAAEVHRKLTAADSVDDLIDHLHCESGRRFGILITRSYSGIDKQTKMRVIDLDNVGARITNEFDFPAQNRHACAHKISTLRICSGRFVRAPEALAQESWGGQGRFDPSFCGSF